MWIEWKGDWQNPPVKLRERHDVMYRDGTSQTYVMWVGSEGAWKHTGGAKDVMHYQKHPESIAFPDYTPSPPPST